MSSGNGHKPGPKPKIGEKEQAQVIAIVACGGSIADAADVLGVARDTINRSLRENIEFRKGVDRAAARGKLRLIKKVRKSEPWQAAAWMLERKWGAEYGKRLELEHAGGVKIEVVFRPASSPAENGNGRIAEHANGNGHSN